MLVIGSLNQPNASGPDDAITKPLTFIPISSQSLSYNSFPPLSKYHANHDLVDNPIPPPATGDPNNIAAGW